MSDESKKTTPRIRTFAGDMKLARGGRESSSDQPTDESVSDAPKEGQPEKSSSQTKTKLEKQKPATGFKAVARSEDKEDKEEVPDKSKDNDQPKTEPKQTDDASETIKKLGADLESQKKTKVIKTPGASGATVITDTQKKRFRLFPTLVKSVKDWFKEITTPKKKKVPQYTIPETRRRKGVIQTATSKTGSIFSADSKTIKEKIRRRRLEEKRRAEEEAQEPEIAWSPYTDVGYNLLEEPDETTGTQNVQVEFKKHHRPAETKTEPESEEEDRWAAPTPPATPAADPAPKPPAATKKDVASEVDAESSTPEPETTESDKSTTETTTETDVEETTEPQPETRTAPQPTTPPTQGIEQGVAIPRRQRGGFDTNTLAVLVLIVIIGVVILVFAGKLMFEQMVLDNETQSTNANQAEAVLDNSTLETITITSENASTMANLIRQREVAEDSTLTEHALVTQSGAEIVPSYVLDTLNFNTLPSLETSLTSVRFVSFFASKDIMLLKFVDETTVRGSLLYWEDNMATDLANVFDIAPTGPTFTDAVVSGVDVRVLENGSGTVLLYGIIDENTALFATSEADFAQIINTEFSN